MKPKMPTQPDPVRIPTPDDPDMKAASRARLAEDEAKKKGRSSTNLTGSSSYSRTTLG
jgi:hypothetical protein